MPFRTSSWNLGRPGENIFEQCIHEVEKRAMILRCDMNPIGTSDILPLRHFLHPDNRFLEDGLVGASLRTGSTTGTPMLVNVGLVVDNVNGVGRAHVHACGTTRTP